MVCHGCTLWAFCQVKSVLNVIVTFSEPRLVTTLTSSNRAESDQERVFWSIRERDGWIYSGDLALKPPETSQTSLAWPISRYLRLSHGIHNTVHEVFVNGTEAVNHQREVFDWHEAFPIRWRYSLELVVNGVVLLRTKQPFQRFHERQAREFR